jgi:hypothetical protein
MPSTSREDFVQRMNDAELGLYRSLAAEGPATPAELARRTGTIERLVREWLEQQGAADLLTASRSTYCWIRTR